MVLELEQLRQNGLPPADAMRRFADWLLEILPPRQKPIMLAFNAPFDWMFIDDYFIRYLGTNPFGHSAIDIKAVYLGSTGKSWKETSGVYLHAVIMMALNSRTTPWTMLLHRGKSSKGY